MMRHIYVRCYLTYTILVGGLVAVSLGELHQATLLRAEPLPAETFSDWFLERPDALTHFGPLFESPGTMGIAISQGGKYLVLGTTQREVLHDDDCPQSFLYLLVYDMQQRRYTHVVRIDHESDRRCNYPNVEISPDDSRIAVAHSDSLMLFELEKEKGKLRTLWEKQLVWPKQLGRGADFRVRSPAVTAPKCTFSPCGKHVIAVVDINPFIEFETTTGNLSRRIDPKDVVPEDFQDPSWWCNYAIRRDGSEVAMVLDSGAWNKPRREVKQGILLVDVKSKKTHFLQLKDLAWCFVRCCFHPTRKLLAAAYLDEGKEHTRTRNLCVIPWDYENLASEVKFTGTQWEDCSQIEFCPSGDFLILTVDPKWLSDPNLLILDPNTLKVRAAYRVRPGRVYNFRFSPKGDSLILVSSDGHVVQIDWPKLLRHISGKK